MVVRETEPDHLAVEARDVRKSYGKVTALDGVSLVVRYGEICALLGPNGAGKTTLLHCLATLLMPDSGMLRIAGHDLHLEPLEVRRAIGVGFQDVSVDLDLTGRELLDHHGRIYRLTAARRARRIEELAPLLALGEALDRRVKTYSGGMRRRLEIARALLHEPPVVLLDEPTSGLDPQNRAALWEVICGLRERGHAVLVATHYLEEAERLADRVVVVDEGRVLAEGAPRDLVRDLAGEVLEVEGMGDAAGFAGALEAVAVSRVTWEEGRLDVPVADAAMTLPQVVELAMARGFRVTSLRIRRPGLNEVFLALTGRGVRD